jgi:hypothetical protein
MDSNLADLCLAFERMRRYGLKMNPLKCAFVVSAGCHTPVLKSTEPKPPYVCPGCLITHIATI